MTSDKLSTESYKGVRDFYPEDMFIQKHIFERMRKAVEKFGYVEYGASVLEPAELYRAKSGEEIVNEQTYTFTDRGDREVTLRPEMTPTVARMVSAKRRELVFPSRWYSIPNLFRYEKPQRGRTREHWQLNVDLFGSEDIQADIEILSVAHEIMRSFGATDHDFEIRVNSREIINAEIAKNKLSATQGHAYMKLLDKKSKLPKETFEAESKKILIDGQSLTFELDQKLKAMISSLAEAGIKNVVYDETIVRGFDYYTGMIFEVYDTDPENRRSLFGGGRFDNLTELFGGEKIPAVGFGMGDVTIRDFLETHDLTPAYKPSAQLYIAIQDQNCRPNADLLASTLRESGLNVIIDISHKKIGDQIKTADRQKVPYVTAIGAEEVKSGAYRIKDLANGTEKILKTDEVAAYLRSQLAI